MTKSGDVETVLPRREHVLEAAARIRPHAKRTPVLTSRSLDRITGKVLFFKCENFQRVGAFKFRGALNAVLSLPDSKVRPAAGVATHSSGNHGAALSLAARIRGLAAHIVMPRTASEIKKRAVQEYGGQITFCEPTLAQRQATVAEVLRKTGAVLVHPYDDPAVVAGQGTAALELVDAVPDLDVILAPVGGGGLLGGSTLAAQGTPVRVLGAEPAGADDAYRSLQVGRILPSENPQTLADGLLTSLGQIPFAILRSGDVGVITVQDETIVQAMRLVWERMKILIEPSAAVPLAAVLEKPDEVPGDRVGVIFSGGNVDLDRLPWCG